MSKDQSAAHEIVIIRRGSGDDEEGHHGGVWKIAYADFMTAMMAFFLVMWLVNAADKKVLTQVATYFNPLRMSERVTADKGIEDLSNGQKKQRLGDQPPPLGEAQSEAKEEKEPSKGAGKTKDKDKEKAAAAGGKVSEDELRNDPYGTLAILAKRAEQNGEAGAAMAQRTEPAPLADPFDQGFADRVTETAGGKAPASKPAQASPKLAAQGPQSAEGEASAHEPVAGETSDDPAAQKKAAELEAALRAALANMPSGKRPDITVMMTPEGLLISLTDEFDFGMFASASSVPNEQLVAALKKLAPLVAEQPGDIVVRGHTDAQPFRGGKSDNWRLSAERALAVRHMLIFGGVPEMRFAEVEGYADRRLKLPANPLAAPNRRIELLLRKAEAAKP